MELDRMPQNDDCASWQSRPTAQQKAIQIVLEMGDRVLAKKIANHVLLAISELCDEMGMVEWSLDVQEYWENVLDWIDKIEL